MANKIRKEILKKFAGVLAAALVFTSLPGSYLTTCHAEENSTSQEDLTGAILPATETTFNATRVHLSKTKLKVAVGKSKTIKLVKAKAKSVKWKVKNKKIATVKSGKITGKKPGSTVVTAKYKKKSYTCKVTVTTNVKLSKKIECLLKSQKYKLHN